MKSVLSFFVLSFFVLSTYGQDNPTNAVNLLSVPAQFVKYNGQIQSKVKWDLTEEITIDRTNVDTINGKLVRVIDTTYRYIATPTAQQFGYYSLNLLSNYINSFGYDVVSDSELNKPGRWATVNVGEFAGQSYYFGYSSVKITPANNGYAISVYSYPYMTVETNGMPTSNHWITIKQTTTIITGSVNLNQRTLTVTKSNIKAVKGAAVNVRVTKSDLEARSKKSESEIAELTRTVFQVTSTNGSLNCNSMATSLVRSGIKYSGTVYFNGHDAKTINYRSLNAPYGQKRNGYVTRFHLYNGEVKNLVYGSTFTKQLTESELAELNVVAGSSFKYDANSNTLTYDANKPAELRFQFELLPAQGKQPAWETRIDLSTGAEIH